MSTKYVIFIFPLIVFLFLLVFFPESYDLISREDRLIEYLTAIGLGITGVIFLFNARKLFTYKDRSYLFVFFLISGVIFLFGAGEEISWGQRIFNIPTPEKLAEINDQNELNLHNIDKKFFDRLLNRALILLTYIGVFFYLRDQKHFLKIPMPDYSILLIFILIPLYHQYNNLELEFYHLQYLPLLILLGSAIWKKDSIQMGMSLFTIVLAVLLLVIHTRYNHHFAVHNNSANEYRELLFSLAWILYAWQIAQNLFKARSAANR